MSNEQRHEFEVVSSKDAYIGRVIALRSDEVLMPGGGTAIREVIEHYGAVAILALHDDQTVTMIHQYRHPMQDRLWELPAGLLDVATESPVVAAQRELLEETGVTAKKWSVLVDVAASPGFTDEVVRVFLAQELTEVTREVPEGDEETDLVVHRIPLADAVQMVLRGEIINASTAAGILAAHAVLTGAGISRSAGTPWPSRPKAFAARKI